MSSFTGTFAVTNFADLLRMLVQAKQTGVLNIGEAGKEGVLAVENGMIVHAETPPDTGMRALFKFVGWRTASFAFREQSLAANLPHDLAVYDPMVLIAGVAEQIEKPPPTGRR
jgi:hypothetical protein